jgi:hypothetical protein
MGSAPNAIKATLIDGPQTVACTLISGTSFVTWWRIAADNGARGWVAEDFLRKTPSLQSDSTLNLSIAGSSLLQIAAASRANLRVALETSTNLTNWIALATNTISTNGATTFNLNATDDRRNFRARLLLPDRAP